MAAPVISALPLTSAIRGRGRATETGRAVLPTSSTAQPATTEMRAPIPTPVRGEAVSQVQPWTAADLRAFRLLAAHSDFAALAVLGLLEIVGG